jgi:hypothetical protein
MSSPVSATKRRAVGASVSRAAIWRVLRFQVTDDAEFRFDGNTTPMRSHHDRPRPRDILFQGQSRAVEHDGGEPGGERGVNQRVVGGMIQVQTDRHGDAPGCLPNDAGQRLDAPRGDHLCPEL